jgi:hypothetical protein
VLLHILLLQRITPTPVLLAPKNAYNDLKQQMDVACASVLCPGLPNVQESLNQFPPYLHFHFVCLFKHAFPQSVPSSRTAPSPFTIEYIDLILLPLRTPFGDLIHAIYVHQTCHCMLRFLIDPTGLTLVHSMVLSSVLFHDPCNVCIRKVVLLPRVPKQLTMSDSHINYREDYFQHPSLTKISGDPTYSSLAKLEKECKANDKSVWSTLGGDSQGHLGLVSIALSYDHVSPGIPFVRPVLPVLPDLTNATGNQIAEAQQLHSDNMNTFKACNLIERTIIQQINTAIDEDCLTDLIDDDTGLLEGTVSYIMKELFETYGAITPQSLTSAKDKLEATIYNHTKPIVNVFTAINDYANMAEAADAPETTMQLINIGLIIITRSTIFASDVRAWHDKAEADKTWPNFKDHFKVAQKVIKKSQPAVTTDSFGFHEQANAASHVDQVINRLTAQQDIDTIMHNESAAEQVAKQQMQQQGSNMENSTQQNQTMIEQMQTLMSTISTLQTQVNNNGQNRGRSNGGRGRQSSREGHGGRNRSRHGQIRLSPKYCWTHGNCAHPGSKCASKTNRHIDGATYANMQGGSTNNCN